MIKPLPFLALALLCAAALDGQTLNQFSGETSLINMQHFMQIDANYRAGQPAGANVQGSPRLFKSWLPARISVRGKDHSVDNLLINIDQELLVLLVKLDDDKGPGVVKPEIVDTITVETPDGRRVFRPLAPAAVGDNAPGKERFYEVLYDGRFQLLKAYVKIFRKAEGRDAYSRDQTVDKYVDEEYYLLRTPDGDHLRYNKLKQKNLEKDLPRYQAAIARLAAKEQLDPGNDADAARLLRLLDEQRN